MKLYPLLCMPWVQQYILPWEVALEVSNSTGACSLIFLWSLKMLSYHGDNKLKKRRKNWGLGGRPMCLLALPVLVLWNWRLWKKRGPASLTTIFWFWKIPKKWAFWDHTVWCVVLYHPYRTPSFISSSSLQPPNNERCLKPEACSLLLLSRQDFHKR
jgi:hypothetical protein